MMTVYCGPVPLNNCSQSHRHFKHPRACIGGIGYEDWEGLLQLPDHQRVQLLHAASVPPNSNGTGNSTTTWQ